MRAFFCLFCGYTINYWYPKLRRIELIMKNAFQLIALLSLIVTAPLLANTIYKTVQADGTVVYSDVPSRDSVPVNMVLSNNVIIPKLADPMTTGQDNSEIKQPTTQYQITVLSPRPQETIRNNNGEVNINFEITQIMSESHIY